MSPLRIGEVAQLLDEPTCLGGVVVLHGGLKVLAERDGLTELAPEPAKQADARRGDRH